MSNITSILNSTAHEFEIKTSQERFPKDYMEKSLSFYTSLSTFDDNTWIINKLNLDENKTNKERSIYFGTFKNKGLLYETKEWAIKLLLQRTKTRTISFNVARIRYCDKVLENIDNFGDLTEKDVFNIYSHIFNNENRGIKTNLENWFSLKSMMKDLNYQNQYFMMEKYITPQFPDKRKIKTKYIPKECAIQLDIIFKKQEDIPLAYRVIYWTLRLIPNRIMEVLSMTINCLKQINKDTYILSIPSFKQSGSFLTGTMKLIEIKNEGIGEYYISLLKQQIYDVTTVYKPDNNFLFYSYNFSFYKKKNSDEKKYHKSKSGKFKNISTDSVNRFFKTLCEYRNIHDNEGTPINITTHQFRHNAISDRMNSGIFRAIDITGLTKHHNTKMIEETYTHTSKCDLKKKTPILFRGRIINTNNERKLNQLLIKPYAKRIYNLGICSDVRGCSKDKSQCLRCDYMIPNVDDLDYYKSEIEVWNKKKETALKIGNEDFSDLCQYWIDSYKIIIKRILTALSNEKDIELRKDYEND